MNRAELYGQATFDAAGVARAEAGPVPFGRVYTIRSLSVRTTLGTSPRTGAAVYRNSPLDPNRMDVTKFGGNGATTDVVIVLFGGERLVVVWTGGTAGAVANFAASGDQQAA